MADVTISFSLIDGSVFRGTGFIHLDNFETESGKLTMSATPRDNRWEVFAGAIPDTVGTLKGLSVAGVGYRVSGGCNIQIPPGYKNEGVETSGGSLRKMTKQARTVTGIELEINPTEYETLRGIADIP